VRIGKRALPDVYDNTQAAFTAPGKGNLVVDNGDDVALVAAGETVSIAVETAELLKQRGVQAKVVDLVSVKPIDKALLNRVADATHNIVTIEEHSIIGGIGSAVAEVLASRGDTKIDFVGFPDEPAISGPQLEVFGYYGIDAKDIADKIAPQI
jgi:transketolase